MAFMRAAARLSLTGSCALLSLLSVQIFAWAVPQARAEGVGDCMPALMQDQTDLLRTHDFSGLLAQTMTEGEWSAAQSKFGASFPIDGVPLGVRFSDFSRRASQKYQSYQYQFDRKNIDDLHQRLLGPTAGAAFSDCLSRLQGGIALSLISVQGNDVLVRFLYPTASDDNTARTFHIAVEGGKISDDSLKQFGEPKVGSIDWKISIAHDPHQPLKVEVTKSGSGINGVVIVPLLPRIFVREQAAPVRTQVVDTGFQYGPVNATVWPIICVHPDDGYQLIPGTAVFEFHDVLEASSSAWHFAKADPSTANFRDDAGEVCAKAQFQTLNNGRSIRYRLTAYANQVKTDPVMREIPQDQDWLSSH